MSAVSSQPVAAGASDWRLRMLLSAFLVASVALAARLVHLQWVHRDSFTATVDRQRAYIDTIPARPGEILDRRGKLLATTVTARSLYVVPRRMARPWKLARKLGASLNANPQNLFERIAAHRDKQFLWIERRLREEKVRRIRRLGLPKEIWGFRDEYLRRYPQGKLAAHVLGLRDIDGEGQGGVEQSLEHILQGRGGRRVLLRDARGRVIAIREAIAQAPRPGRSVVLSLSSIIQLYAERELDDLMDEWKPRSACAIVLDPQNGEILAMASRPAFNANHPADVPEEAWKNTAISAIYEPGSTFKPFVVAWALQKGVIQKNEVFDCENGTYRMGDRLLHDHHAYGKLDVENIVVKSSNIGMAKIAEQLGNKELYKAAIAFGFGSRTGIELPGELTGVVRPLRKWDAYSTGSVPMGQEIAVTPLQLIAAHAALANGGRLITPRLFLGAAERGNLTEADIRRPSPAVVSDIIKPEIARWMVQGPLRNVVERGTGRRAQIDGYTVFGKTGTAQKPDPETGAYSSRLHVSSFVCGAPAENPRVLVLVLADEPSVGEDHYGGVVAAPAAAEILHHSLLHLGVPPNSVAEKP